MQIPISSNIVTFVYTSLEMILTILTPLLLSRLAGIFIIRSIYDYRRRIQLTLGRWQFFSHHGLAEPKYHIFAFPFMMCIVALLTAGAFGIVGVTTQEEEIQVRYRVKEADPGHYLKLDKSFSFSTGKISGEVLLLRSSCITRVINSEILYESVYDDEIPQSPTLGARENIDATCLTVSSGFASKRALTSNVTQNMKLPNGECLLLPKKYVKGIPQNTFTNPFKQIKDNCTVNVRDVWCFKHKNLFCAAHMQLEISGFRLVVWAQRKGRTKPTVSKTTYSNLNYASQKLKAAAVLKAMKVATRATGADKILSLQVEKDATVTRLKSRQVTIIDDDIMLFTLLPAVVMIFLLSVVTFVQWVLVIHRPQRHAYNRFNTATDLLASAIVEKYNICRNRFLPNAIITVRAVGNSDDTEVRIEAE